MKLTNKELKQITGGISVWAIIAGIAGEKKELTTKGLKKYLEKNSFKITSIEGKIKEAIQESEESMKNVNNENQKVYTFYSTVSIIFAFFTFFTFIYNIIFCFFCFWNIWF